MSEELMIAKPPKDFNSYVIEMAYIMWFLLHTGEDEDEK